MKKLFVCLVWLFATSAFAQSANVKIWDGTDIATVTGGALDVNATVSTVGLATSAKQDTGNTSLSSIDGKITACNTGAVVISSGSLTCNAGTNLNTSALATEATLSTLNGKVTACNTGAVVVSSAPTTAVTGTFWQATQPVSGTFWQATQPVSGTVTVTDGAGALNTIVDSGTLTAVTAITNALPAGTNGIGKLTANSGVDIGDVTLSPDTTGGLTTYHLVSAATTNATVVKASAGQLYGWYIYNSNAAARKLAFHNTASTPTAGASIYFTVMLPAGSAANVFSDIGIPFSAGIAITTVTEIADNGTTAVAANDLIVNLYYK